LEAFWDESYSRGDFINHLENAVCVNSRTKMYQQISATMLHLISPRMLH